MGAYRRQIFVIQRRKQSRRFRCGRKWGYPNAANARSDMARLSNRTGDTNLQTYHCRRCRGWHVGHPPQPKGALNA